MSLLTRNFAANFGASIVAAVVALLVIPLYIRVLGMEPYGLIAFYLALRAALQVLDLGAGSVVNREVARYAVRGDDSAEGQDGLYTVQVLYWVVAAAIGVAIVASAPVIATNWLVAKNLSSEAMTASIRLIGILIAIQWPVAFYQSALLGLQRQVVLNVVLTLALLVTHAAALALMLWRPSVEIFFLCAIGVAFLQVTTLAGTFWRSMPPARARAFRPGALRPLARFALGVGAISVIGVILAHADKVILSVVLPLDRFAHYSIAAMIAGALVVITAPVFNTIYPRYSALFAVSQKDAIAELHHFSTQLVTVAVVPAALTIIFFCRDIVEIWTRSATTAESVAPLAMLLVGGSAVNGVMTIPYALQLSHGWTRPALIFGILAVVGYLPFMFLMAISYEGEGAAFSWLLFNVVYFVVMAPIIHRHLLPGTFAEWLGLDVLLPTVCAAAVVALAAALPRFQSEVARLALITGTCAVAVLVTGGAAGRIRRWALQKLRAGRSS